jgi:DNA-binding transcriptional regulator GbsR (MarR family)
MTGTQHVVERLCLRFEEDGLPRIAGRLLGTLILSPDALSLDELSETVQASKASVSTNCRLLERLGAVERVTRPGDRRDFYQVADDLHERILGKRLEQLEAIRVLLTDVVESAAVEDATVERRLRDFASFFGHMVAAVESAGASWMAERTEEQPARKAG